MTENPLPSEEVLHHAARQLGHTCPGQPMQQAVTAISSRDLAEIKDFLSFHCPAAGLDLTGDLGPHAAQAYEACVAELDRRQVNAREGN